MTLSIPGMAFAVTVLAAISPLPRHPGSIVGQVRDETGQGVIGVQVTLGSQCGTLSGPQGQFGLTSVEHGEYVLSGSAPGFAPIVDTIVVLAGGTVHVSLDLTPLMSRPERDSIRARLVTLLTPYPAPPAPGEWWIRDCR